MSPTLIQYHLAHSVFLPLLVYNFYTIIEKSDSHHPSSIYLILQFQYICIVFSELLTWILKGKNFYQLQHGVYYSSFCLRVFTHLLSYLGKHLPTPSMRLFHTFVIFKLFCSSLPSILESPWPLKPFFLICTCSGLFFVLWSLWDLISASCHVTPLHYHKK